MEYLLLTAVFVSFFLAMMALPSWISKCRRVGLVWEDMNKFGHPKNVAATGGIVVIMAFVLGVLYYVALKTFLFSGTNNSVEIFSLLGVILILGIVGLTDDLLGWKNHGLPIKVRIALAFIASVPLVVIKAGQPIVAVPFLGMVNFGIIYPLVLVPLGIAGASTTYNFLAGYNGLESGLGILILSFLSFVAYFTGSPWLAIVGLCMVASLIAFLVYNKFPAKVFPGDVLTYSIGALIAGMAIIGNFEKVAIIVFIPFIIEVFLKSRGRLKKHSFGIPDKKGNLRMPYDKIYGLEHLAIKVLGKRATERKVVYLLYAFQILFILIAFLMLI
jgi:UDP-N-acetylglucosamine--dolichyl-phosphate N-acetylglucosaminephosphotransferase